LSVIVSSSSFLTEVTIDKVSSGSVSVSVSTSVTASGVIG